VHLGVDISQAFSGMENGRGGWDWASGACIGGFEHYERKSRLAQVALSITNK